VGGAVIVKVAAWEVPPPGPGVKILTEAVPGVASNDAGTVATSCAAVVDVAATYEVPRDVVPPGPLHCTVEHARKLVVLEAVMVSVCAATPARAVVGDIAPVPNVGAARPAAGDDIVNGSAFDVPDEFDTVTAAGVFVAVSPGRIVPWILFGGVDMKGGRADPFQFTIESVVKPVPFTVKGKLLVSLQYRCDPGDSVVSDGGVPGAAVIENSTMLETSVVVVLFTLDVPDWAEPGICTATCTLPVDVRSEAGTGAVN
jgi:hypothetical protein